MKTAPARFEFSFIHDADGVCSWHDHECAELIFYLAGTGHTLTQNGPLPFHPHSLFYMPPRSLHAQENKTVGADCCILFDVRHVSWLNAVDHPLYIIEGISEDTQTMLLRLGRKRRASGVTEQQTCDLILNAILLDLKPLFSLPETNEPEAGSSVIEQAKLYMREHLDRVRSIEEIARQVGLSADYFRHQFTQEVGISPKTFLTQIRIDYAKDLLTHSPLPQKAIAAQCGFDNERYFNTRFSRLCGMTPGVYRKQSRTTG